MDSRKPATPAKPNNPAASAKRHRLDQIAAMTEDMLVDADAEMCADLLDEFRELRAELKVQAPVPVALVARYNTLRGFA